MGVSTFVRYCQISRQCVILNFLCFFFKQRMLLEVVLFVLIKSRPSRADYLCHMGFFRTYVVSFEIRK